jgi:hypothetical protein
MILSTALLGGDKMNIEVVASSTILLCLALGSLAS